MNIDMDGGTIVAPEGSPMEKYCKEQEIESLKRIPDSFSKIVVVGDYLKPWQDDNGITYMGIEQFLLDENVLR